MRLPEEQISVPGQVRPMRIRRAIRQATTRYKAGARSIRSMAPSWRSSTQQPFLSTLNSMSISQRARHQSIGSLTAAASVATRLVNRRHSIRSTPGGAPYSRATIQAGLTDLFLPAFSSTRRAQRCWRTMRAAPIHACVVEEAVRRHRLAPPVACLGHAGRGRRRYTLHQWPRSPVQARIAQIELPNSVSVHAVDLLAICAMQRREKT